MRVARERVGGEVAGHALRRAVLWGEKVRRTVDALRGARLRGRTSRARLAIVVMRRHVGDGDALKGIQLRVEDGKERKRT